MPNIDFSNRRPWPIYLFFFCSAILIGIADRAPMHLQTRFPQVQIAEDFLAYQSGVVERSLPGPFIYRALIPYGYAFIFSNPPSSHLIEFDFVVKVLLLTLLQFTFWHYLRAFVSPSLALTGIFLFIFLLSYSLSYIAGPSVIETIDLFNALLFCVVLYLMYKDRFVALCVALFIGMLNRETLWILLPFFILSEWLNERRFVRIAIVAVVLAVPYFGLRFLIESGQPTWFTTQDIIYNIPFLSPTTTQKALVANLHLAVLLGPLMIAGLIDFQRQPKFLRMAASIVPLFILIHYIFGSIIERRLWMPAFVLLIPLVVNNLAALVTGRNVDEGR